jgi:quercetin dioxygenase-like cupin family protein
MMNSACKLLAIAALASIALTGNVFAQESKRTELKRSDLSGTNMEVIVSISEFPPGAQIPKHFHYGEEAFYVLEGAMTQSPGQEPQMRPTGASGINVREVPHAGYKVVGDKTLKLLTVHVVDKGKPLYNNVP